MTTLTGKNWHSESGIEIQIDIVGHNHPWFGGRIVVKHIESESVFVIYIQSERVIRMESESVTLGLEGE